MSENVLELNNITMKFGGVTALNEVNLVVKKGEILALIGPNGAGKTTIFNVITGVYKPTSGDVVFQGSSIVGKKRFQITKLGIARTFQNIRLFGESSALENVVTGADVHSKTGVIGSIFGTPQSRREEKAALEKDKIENPQNYISVVKSGWETGGFGTVALVSFTLKNES